MERTLAKQKNVGININSIGKGPFGNPNKALVNALRFITVNFEHIQ